MEKQLLRETELLKSPSSPPHRTISASTKPALPQVAPPPWVGIAVCRLKADTPCSSCVTSGRLLSTQHLISIFFQMVMVTTNQ